jgi:hypothetical protein
MSGGCNSMGNLLQCEKSYLGVFMQEEPSLVSSVWAQRSLGIDLPKNPDSVAPRDVKHVCDSSYPFIQLINSNAVFAEETPINFITTSDGWVIHDYGDAISVSAPHDVKDEGSIV